MTCKAQHWNTFTVVEHVWTWRLSPLTYSEGTGDTMPLHVELQVNWWFYIIQTQWCWFYVNFTWRVGSDLVYLICCRYICSCFFLSTRSTHMMEPESRAGKREGCCVPCTAGGLVWDIYDRLLPLLHPTATYAASFVLPGVYTIYMPQHWRVRNAAKELWRG